MSDLHTYLRQHEAKDLLRLLACGSVDDGKSTLIGRLLYDTQSLYDDQLAALRKDSVTHGTTGTDFDPALLTDGLKDEREQGITIDVAYRYLSTARRTFIIADTPGHEQYTRNMATGASTCSLAIVLVDARHGLVTQTRRHAFIASLLGIRQLVVAVNKMDLVHWSESVFNAIRDEFNQFVARLDFAHIQFIPMSALHGDQVARGSAHMPWYRGPSLLDHLEQVNLATERNLIDLRLPVQSVFRPNPDFRGYAGTIASGVLRVGDPVLCLPSRRQTAIRSIESFDGPRTEAYAPMATVVTLEDDVDAGRGSMLVHPNNVPSSGNEFDAMLVWMDAASAGKPGTTYLVKHTTQTVPGGLARIRYRVDINTLRQGPADELAMNDIGRVQITLHRAIDFDPYTRNRATGSFILIDRITNVTVAAGMILDRTPAAPARSEPKSRNIVRETSLVDAKARHRLLGQRGVTIWLTGLSGAGKSTIARALEATLIDRGHPCYILDGDNIRHGLNDDLGFSAHDRRENIRRIARVAELFNEAGLIVITAFISPYREDRDRARAIIGSHRFLEVHVSTAIEVCEQRDPKGLYRKARAGEIPGFTGITDPYEPPLQPELELDTSRLSIEASVEQLLVTLERSSFRFDQENR